MGGGEATGSLLHSIGEEDWEDMANSGKKIRGGVQTWAYWAWWERRVCWNWNGAIYQIRSLWTLKKLHLKQMGRCIF